MCFGAPKLPPLPEPEPPPPPPPPPPAPTAQGLTIGSERKNFPELRNFLSEALGARRTRNTLRIDLGGAAPVGAGLNIPQG